MPFGITSFLFLLDPRIKRVNLLNNNFSLAGFQYRPAHKAGQHRLGKFLIPFSFQYRPAHKAGRSGDVSEAV